MLSIGFYYEMDNKFISIKESEDNNMKKFQKRLVSLVLVLSMVVVPFSNNIAFAENANGTLDYRVLEKEHDDEFIDDEVWETYDEIDGVKYYFKDTSRYTVNVIEDNKGDMYLYVKDKISNTIQSYEKKSEKKFDGLMSSYKEVDIFVLDKNSDYSEIEELINSCQLVEEYKMDDFLLEESNIDDLSEDNNLLSQNAGVLQEKIDLDEEVELNASTTSVASRVDRKLRSYYGSPFSNRHIGTYREKGKTAKLYHSMHFERYKYHSWGLVAGTTVGMVASIVSLPASTILATCAFVSVGAGFYGLAKSFTANEYVANVHWNKVVQVGSIYPYRAGKTIKGRIFLGDIDAAYSKKGTNQNWDYDDNLLLMKTGIKNTMR